MTANKFVVNIPNWTH